MAIRSIEYRPFRPIITISDYISDGICFVFFIIRLDKSDEISLFIIRPESLIERARIILDDHIRRFNNRLRTSIILFEFYNVRIWIILIEIQYILNIRSTPRVNSLPVITDDAEIPSF